jgi:hypothetical protein
MDKEVYEKLTFSIKCLECGFQDGFRKFVACKYLIRVWVAVLVNKIIQKILSL